MKVRDFTKLYSGLLVLCLAVTYRPHSEALIFISKPALSFSLLAFFIHFTKGRTGNGRQFIIMALATSLAADILMMQSGKFFLLSGLVCLALAQVAYTIFYTSRELSFKPGPIFLSLLVPAIALWVVWALMKVSPREAAFEYGYLVLLSLHFMMSVQYVAALGFRPWQPVVGALLFIAFGVLMADSNFNGNSRYLELAMMLGYGAAQFLVVTGLLERWPDPEED